MIDLIRTCFVIVAIVAMIALGIMIAYVALPLAIVGLFFVVCYILIVDKLRKV